MNKVFLAFCMSLFSIATLAQNQWTAVAPNNSLQIVLTSNNGVLSYKVTAGTTEVVKPSSLGLKSSNGELKGMPLFVKASTKPISEQYRLTSGKRMVNIAKGNETSVLFDIQGMELRIDLRAYNDGVAFRYVLPQKGKKMVVEKEVTSFVIPANGKVWMQNYDVPTDYTPAYEGEYVDGMAIGTNAKDSGGWALPALFQTGNHWLLVTESDMGWNYFGSRFDSNCAGGVYQFALPMQSEAKGFGANTATVEAPFATPWRVIMVGSNLGTIVESNLVNHLATPNKLGNVSWVKPGRASWSWWGDHDSSRDFEKLKKFVDFAREMNWEYSLVDANWNIMNGGNMEQLVRYAAAKKIGLLLWYNSGGPHNVVTEQPRDIISDPVKRKAEFKKLRQWGVKGIKVDFFQSDKPFMMSLYHDILEDAAREHLMVNFHGSTLPRGWSRTYPNLIGMEAVRGAENYGWGKEFAQAAPMLNNILAYTRNVVGPMDYTPVTFSDYECCPHQTTNAHELALSILFETGILHFADRVAAYQQQDNLVKDFLRNVPVVWDETRFVQGYPGKETVLARRNGNTWYVAGANGQWVQKQLQLQLPFLKGGPYQLTLFSDGANPRSIKSSQQIISNSKLPPVNMLPNGGFLMVLSPKK